VIARDLLEDLAAAVTPVFDRARLIAAAAPLSGLVQDRVRVPPDMKFAPSITK